MNKVTYADDIHISNILQEATSSVEKIQLNYFLHISFELEDDR